MIKLEELAHQAASRHSRCEYCDGVCPDTATNCDKSRMYVCPQYWCGYHTALDSLISLCEKLEIPITEVENVSPLGLKEKFHFVQTLLEFATSEECGKIQINNNPIYCP